MPCPSYRQGELPLVLGGNTRQPGRQYLASRRDVPTQQLHVFVVDHELGIFLERTYLSSPARLASSLHFLLSNEEPFNPLPIRGLLLPKSAQAGGF